MKKKLVKWAVTMLAGVMLALPATGNTVSASSEAKSQVQEETKKIENELNYIYIDEAELDVGAVQSIVLSWGESTSDIRSIDLVVENEDGSRTVLNSKKRVDNLFLYEHSFEQGAYHVAELSVTTDLDTKTFTAEDLEINAYFGVGEKVNDSVKSDYIEMESQSEEEAVVTIETANAATVEKNVVDALSEQAVPFDKNKKERSNSNLVIVLDPGHDASKHSGATANGVREEVVTLKIAEYCKEVLEQYSGVSVYMTRTDGNCPYPDTNSIDDILKRVEWAKTKDADVFISFHINSSVSGAAQGAEVYYPQGEENAQELAKDIVGELAKLGLKNRGDKGDDSYAVIRHSKRNGFPGLIIEHAFVSNVSDAKWFQTEENLKKLGEADAAGIIKYYGLTKDKGKWEFTGEHWKWKEGNGKYATSTWKSIDGVWYYFDTNSNMTTGWQQIGGIWYYMNSSGAMTTGWQQIGGTWYYMNGSGAMQTGWQTIGNQTYYLNEGGAMATGWKLVENVWYYFNGAGYLLKGEQTIAGTKWYLDENTGALYTGWHYTAGKWYYHTNEGLKQTGWQFIGGTWYYMNADGVMTTGWQLIGGTWYYMDESGAMTTGWQQVGGTWYYMDGSGAMQTGWKLLGNHWYYMNGSGAMLTGFQSIGNEKFYFNASGEMQTGWQFIDNVWYYFNTSGYLLKGEQTIGGQKWYLDANTGALYTGWHFTDGKWYYHTSEGLKQTGWQKIGETWYYMDKNGVMQTGWQTIGNQKYYFDGSGAMVTGWQLIDNVWYYFENSGELNNQPSSKPPVNDAIQVYYEIAGDSSVTVEQMVSYYKKSGKPYPAEALKAGGAATIEEFCQIYYEECEIEGIKAEVAFVQSMIETGFLQFGGSVKIEQFNFAGLGATGNGVSGNSFENVRIGIRAHVQHLKCYANDEPLKNECVDPRWGEWLRGKAPYVEWLSIPNNPNGTGWAGDVDYAAKLLKGIQDMKKTEASIN